MTDPDTRPLAKIRLTEVGVDGKVHVETPWARRVGQLVGTTSTRFGAGLLMRRML
jgi:hypothetical protein